MTFKEKYNNSMSTHNPSDDLIEKTRLLMQSPPKRRNNVVWKYVINISAACLLIVAVTVAYKLIPNNIEFQNTNGAEDGEAKNRTEAAGAPTNDQIMLDADYATSSAYLQKELVSQSTLLNSLLNEWAVVPEQLIEYKPIANQQSDVSLGATISASNDSYYVNELASVSYPVKKVSSDDTLVEGNDLDEELIIENFGFDFGFYVSDVMTPQVPFSYEVTTDSEGKVILLCYSFDFTQRMELSSIKGLSVRAYPTSYDLSKSRTLMLNTNENYFVGSSISDIEVYLGVGIDRNTNGDVQMAEFIEGDMLYQVVSLNVSRDDFIKTLYTLLESAKQKIE